MVQVISSFFPLVPLESLKNVQVNIIPLQFELLFFCSTSCYNWAFTLLHTGLEQCVDFQNDMTRTDHDDDSRQ